MNWIVRERLEVRILIMEKGCCRSRAKKLKFSALGKTWLSLVLGSCYWDQGFKLTLKRS